MSRESFEVELNDQPRVLTFKGQSKEWLFKPELGSKQLALLGRAFSDTAKAAEVGPEDAAEKVEETMRISSQMLADPADADAWLELDLPPKALLATLRWLVQGYTGGPLAEQSSSSESSQETGTK